MLGETALLQAWESGEGQPSVEQALAILRHGYPERSLGQLLSLSIGERDALLFDLREQSFGSLLRGSARCPSCHEQSLFSVSLSDLRVSPPAQVREQTLSLTSSEQTLSLTSGDLTLRFRLPICHDLRQAATCPDVESARQSLIRACIVSLCQAGVSVPLDRFLQLPAQLEEQLATAIGQHDPQGEVLLSLRCAHCGHAWPSLFDIASFLWSELSTRARRLLSEVDLLARAYGWSEADILKLSSVRRSRYLELASHE